MRHIARISVVGFFLVACGGGQEAKQPGNEHHEGHREGHHEGHEEHHKNLAPPLKDFHEVLAPIWHSTPGAERSAKACAGGDALRDKAAATNDAGLVSSVGALAKACSESDKSQVEPSLEKVHHRFHELAEH